MLYTLTNNINLYHSIFENNASGIVIHDVNLNILEVNSAFCRLLGYEEGELLNLSIIDLTPKEDIARIDKNIANFKARKHNTVKLNRPYIKKDGSMLYLDTDINVVRDSIGDIEFFILSIRDNNKYKITHQALLQTEKRYQILFENSINGISIWDDTGKLIEANPAFCHLLGYTEEELLTKKVHQITAPDDMEMTKLLGRQLRSGEVSSFSRKKVYITKNGEKILCNASVRGIYDKQNNYTGALASIQNISETAKQDRIIWKLNKVMQKSGRAYAQLEGAVHIVARNLKARLGELTDFAGQMPPDISQQQIIENLNDKTQTINATLDSLLNYTNIQAQHTNVEETNMQQVMEEVLSNFDDIGVNTDIIAECLPTSIEIDKNKITQLLHELIDNALKFRAPDAELTIHIKVKEKTDEWMCTISDNGVGIPKNEHYHIFLPFKQLDANIEGLGMGLAICKTIIEQHQGKIYIASDIEDKQGTTVIFSIPKVIQ